MASPFRHLSEYFALRAVAGLASALPYPLALAVGWLNARIMFTLLRFRAREARRRVRIVFGDRFSRRQINAIVWSSWRNTVFNGIEMMRTARVTPEWIEQYADCSACISALRDHVATGKGAIIAPSHMGSWEIGLVMPPMHGIRVFTIQARQRNPYVNEYINRLRRAPGIDLLERGTRTMREVLRRLAAGEVLAILPDVRMPTPGLSVPFLGGEANLGKGMALFAIHAGVPVFPVIIRRDGWTRHVVTAHPPIWPDPSLSKEDDTLRITTAVMRIVEDAIRADPGQWFWFNRRWILDPLPVATPEPLPESPSDIPLPTT